MLKQRSWICIDFSIHPSNTTPSGTKLLELKCFHKDADKLSLNKIMFDCIKMERERFKLVNGTKIGFVRDLKWKNCDFELRSK